MMGVRKLALSCILLILSFPLGTLVAKGTEEQPDYSLGITGYSWGHSILTVSIYPQENEAWWDPAYLDAALHGVAQWNDAIEEFAATQAEFAFVGGLRFVPIITHELVDGFDIYISWIAEREGEQEIGEAQATVLSPCNIVNATICLKAIAPSGHIMTETDMQNIVVHELGHVIGLYHCNYSKDVMYSAVSYDEILKPLSSLDLYVVTQLFEPLLNSSHLSGEKRCPEVANLTLPSNVSYFDLEIGKENFPKTKSQNPVEIVVAFLLRPNVLAIFVIILPLLIVVVLFVKDRRKSRSSRIKT